jgi:murein L,D-transpeptidase YcbB/YkuD
VRLLSARAAIGVLWLLVGLAPAGPAAAVTADPAVITERLDQARHPWLGRPAFGAIRSEARALYATLENEPLWLLGRRAVDAADVALAMLADAGSKGLDPADYDAALLAAKRRALPRSSRTELALFDVALSVAFLRFVSDLGSGRVEPSDADFALDVAPKRAGLGVRVAAGVRTGRVREVVDDAEPDFEPYRRLRDALPRYRALASDPEVVPVVPSTTLHPGDPFPRAAALGRWLAALGDLPSDATFPLDHYAGALVRGVEHFQRRHGLDVDGVIGRDTARALGVLPATRLRQMELALERFRWLPEVGGRRFVFVNVPAFDLHAFDAVGSPRPALSMRVVVGEAGRTPTPVLAAEMGHVVFGPPWNVPITITQEEMLPKIRRDPDYLDRQGMEIVSDGIVLPQTDENLELLAHGTARLRQRPGPGNALGRVKFLFPNEHDVYLHDTPTRNAFRSNRRDFSHGCVRVERPAPLADWVLRAQPEWTPERIREAMASFEERWLIVESPILVLLFYATAEAEPDGSLSFYEDLYGHDAALERRLDELR